jgi:hypothetical protein
MRGEEAAMSLAAATASDLQGRFATATDGWLIRI